MLWTKMYTDELRIDIIYYTFFTAVYVPNITLI